MENYWKAVNADKTIQYNITCVLPTAPIIFYVDGSWVPVKKANERQLKRHLDFLRSNGFIGSDEKAKCWSYPAPQGEMAYDLWESSLEQIDNVPTHPLIDAIEEELRIREI